VNRIFHRVPPPLPGLVAAAGALVLLALPGLGRAALGTELLAAAFWLWARLGDDRREQLARWGWLRRPAMALWLAAALSLAMPPARPALPVAAAPGDPAGVVSPQLVAPVAPAARDPLAPLRAARALAVLWAGLELLAALPLSRPYPDLTGPLPHVGAWLPAVLPAAGFLVLWRQAEVWTGAPWLREVAEVLLLFAAGLAVLRAYTRHSWTASLRWLAVFDSALAALLVALDAVPGEVAFLLWFAAAGGRLVTLAAEVRGATVRRGPGLAALWRAAGWTAGAALAWPLLFAAGFSGNRLHPVPFVLLAAPVYLAASLSLRRPVEVPERRALSRPDPTRALGGAAAIALLALGPVALVLAVWGGFEASLPGVIVALMPPVLALLPRRAAPAPEAVRLASLAAGATARDFALAVYRSVTSAERRVTALLGGLLRALGAPLRDLHTGDAQEYLLFLVGVAVLALLLPLFR
jgi:hypothetical protein